MSDKTQVVHWSAEDFARFIDAAEARGYWRAIDLLRAEAEHRNPDLIAGTIWAAYLAATDYLEVNRDG